MRRLDRAMALFGGVALAVAGVLAGIEIMELVLGNAPLIIPRHAWDRSLRTSQWGDSAMVVTSGIVAGVGVALILLQVVRRRPVRLAARSRPHQRVWVSRKGLARRLTHDVSEIDEIDESKVRVSRNRVRTKVTVSSDADQATGVERVRTVVTDTLKRVGIVHDLRVHVVVRSASPSGERP